MAIVASVVATGRSMKVSVKLMSSDYASHGLISPMGFVTRDASTSNELSAFTLEVWFFKIKAELVSSWRR
jgi:hypothetical protein